MSKRNWRIAGVIGLGAVVALAVQPWRLAEETVERHMLAALTKKFGLVVTGGATGAFAILPMPRLIANDLRVRSADGAFEAKLPRVRAQVDLLALMGGRIEFDQLILFSPTFEAALGAEDVNPLEIIRSSTLANSGASPRVSIQGDGSAFFRRGATIVSSVRNINMDVAARRSGEAVQANGSVTWRGEKLVFALASNSAVRATLPMASIRSELVSLEFNGRRLSQASLVSPDVLEGQILINAPSMARFGAWIASGANVTLPFGDTTIAGTLQLSSSGAQVRNAAVTLGADVLDGAFDWRKKEQRWVLTGTFAGKSLDIGRPLSGIDAQRFFPAEHIPTAIIDLDDLLAHDVDLRLSLQRVRLPGATITDVAAQIRSTDHRFDVMIANAGLYRGTLKGRLSLGRTEAGIDVRSQLSAERVDLGALTSDLFETRRLTGTGTLQHQVETSGRTAGELVANAAGRLTLTARNGEFAGTNLNDAMRRIERQPLAVARDWRGGRTSFEQFTLNGSIAGGSLDLGGSQALGAAYRLTLDGTVSLTDRIYRLTGAVQSPNGGQQIPFDVSGPLADPTVTVNARALLERSGAAAPLLQRPAAN